VTTPNKFGYSDDKLESASDRERFESEVVAADRHSQSEIDFALTWRELTRGLSRVAGWFFTPERCGLVLAMTDHAPEPALAGRRLRILEPILCGVGQKTVAINFELAASTIALNARRGLGALGFQGRPSRVHPLLMQVARAACERSLAAGSISFVSSAIGDLQVIGVPRPDRHLVGNTPAAELEVARLFFEGASYVEIAQSRRTALRTVANQLAAVFKRMAVSGRNELVHRLFALETPDRPHIDTVLPPTMREKHLSSLLVATHQARTSGIRSLSELGERMQLAAARQQA
jgi:DNA-binding CsgD family transcriptional regulator